MIRKYILSSLLLIITSMQIICARTLSYEGQLSQLTDIGHQISYYSYTGTAQASGPIQHAFLGSKAQFGSQQLYTVPIQLQLSKYQFTHNDCSAGRLCANQLGNGDVILFNYAFNRMANPYQMVVSKQVYQKQASSYYKCIAQNRYHYNLQGKLIQTDRQTTGITARSQYDTLGRLISVSQIGAKSQKFQYIYDINSNMLNKIQNDRVTFNTYNGLDQQIISASTMQKYDQFGNQSNSMTGHIYQFNARNQLVSEYSSYPSKVTIPYHYQYFANGFRADKNADFSRMPWPSLHYYYAKNDLLNTADKQGHLSHYLLSTQRIDRLTTNKDTLAKNQVYGMHYYLVGHNSTSKGWLNPKDGAVQITQAYTPFGQKLPTSQFISSNKATELPYQLLTDPIGYDGEQQDAEDGLIYLRTRYYQPSGDRFLSPDNLFYSLRENNRYIYSLADPLNQIDPMGTKSFSQMDKINNFLGDGGVALVLLGQIAGLTNIGSLAASLFGIGVLTNFVSTIIATYSAYSTGQSKVGLGYILSGMASVAADASLLGNPSETRLWPSCLPKISQATTFMMGNFFANAFLSIGMPAMQGIKISGRLYAVAAGYTALTTLTSEMLSNESTLINVFRIEGDSGFHAYNTENESLAAATTFTEDNRFVRFPAVYTQPYFGLYSAGLGFLRGASTEVFRLGATGDISQKNLLMGTVIGGVQGLMIYNGSYAGMKSIGTEGFGRKFLIASIATVGDFSLPRIELQIFGGN